MGVSAPCTADAVINQAISQLGVHEEPFGSNKTPYGVWYPMNGVAWCAIFVSWCLHYAGFPLAITAKHGYSYCPDGVNWFKKQGAWAPAGAKPKRGWIVFFDFPKDGVNRPSHTGLVEGNLADGRVACVEGNTNGAGGRTGGMVMRHNRSVAGGIIGYGIIDYQGASSPVQRKGYDMPLIAPKLAASHPDHGKVFLVGNGVPTYIPHQRELDEMIPVHGPVNSVSDVTWDVYLEDGKK